eukprot:CAMPEP_0172672372 /NCGR_PEP_ID=MMETSP1074-20121228/11504_1 /TAXON_ID=2916 /ORGANISM="Ceratium fusus, Strain PA161109" /LENGTH=79 /DNA_ID=CAMNT_0013489545 /DNA_START=1 /DNA_END=241 /DNA_ORIENTATION=-
MWKIAYHPEPLKPVKQPDAKEVALASGGYLGCLLKNNGSVSQCLNYGLWSGVGNSDECSVIDVSPLPLVKWSSAMAVSG